MPISFNLDVTKLDKKKFFKGKKGLYADLMLWETEEGSQSAEYGDFIVKQQGEKGEKMPILGNAKYSEKKGKRNGKKRDRDEDDEADESSIPF